MTTTPEAPEVAPTFEYPTYAVWSVMLTRGGTLVQLVPMTAEDGDTRTRCELFFDNSIPAPQLGDQFTLTPKESK